MRKIDPKNIFTIQIFDMCDVDSKEFPEEEIKKCRNMAPAHIAKTKYSQLIYEYGGQDLTVAPRTMYFEEIFIHLGTIFQGIMIMDNSKHAHLDIKPANLIYNSETHKTSLIDFGLCRKYDEIYNELTPLLTVDYAYFPPEFKTIATVLKNRKNLNVNPWKNYNLFIKVPYILPIFKSMENEMESYSEFVTFLMNLGTNENKKNYVKDLTSKIDIYMFGLALIQIMSISKPSNDEILDSKFIEFIKNMMMFNPIKRFNPAQAFNAFIELRDYIVNRKTSSVKHVSPKKQDVKLCQDGFELDPLTNKCKKISIVKNVSSNSRPCPEGYELDSSKNKCIKVKAVKAVKAVKQIAPVKTIGKKQCPNGSEINPLTNRCKKNKTASVKIVNKKSPGSKLDKKQSASVKIVNAKSASSKLDKKQSVSVKVVNKKSPGSKLDKKQSVSVKVVNKKSPGSKLDKKQSVSVKVVNKKSPGSKLDKKQSVSIKIVNAKSKKCPDGSMLNPLTNRCNKIKVVKHKK
jgi:serine/threonine protein kinase